MKIILDTNFLMAIAQFKIDIFSEIDRIADFKYEICILDKTIDELNNIIETQKGKNKQAAKLALAITKSHPIRQIKTGKGKTDDLLVKLANKQTIIATQDRLLRKRIKTKIIGIRQKKYLYIRNL
ncbi:nucleotide-binding protein [Candidatus Woesearchaeota archaeon]|nr:nucleotide-binding protein [Candidatus Woesearchaeota archaeon]